MGQGLDNTKPEMLQSDATGFMCGMLDLKNLLEK